MLFIWTVVHFMLMSPNVLYNMPPLFHLFAEGDGWHRLLESFSSGKQCTFIRAALCTAYVTHCAHLHIVLLVSFCSTSV